MGRQINFYQLESDLDDLMSFLNDKNLLIFDDFHNQGHKITNTSDIYIAKGWCSINKEYVKVGSGNSPIEYCVPMPLRNKGITETLSYNPNTSSYEKINIENMKVINNGRFYLPNNYYENEELVSIYNLLVKYIKKKYLYSKQMFSYFSPAFIASYKKGDVFAANSNNIYVVKDI